MADRSARSQRLSKDLWAAYFALLVTWGVLSYANLGSIYAQGKLFAYLDRGRPYIADFVNIYNAGVLARRCLTERLDVYDPAVQEASSRKLTGAVVAEQPFYLQTPPFFFALALPLSYMSLTDAFVLWNLLGVLLLAITTMAISRGILAGRFATSLALVAALVSFPAWVGIRQGNSSVLIVPALIIFWYLMMRKKHFLSGIASAACLMKIQYLPVIALVGFVSGRAHFAAGLAAAAVILSAVTIPVLGWSNMAGYPAALTGSLSGATISGVAAEIMQNLRGALALLPLDSRIVTVASFAFLLIALALVLCIWVTYGRTCDTGEDFRLRASLTVLIMLISSPHTHAHDYAMMVVPAVWLWQAAGASQVSVSYARILRILVILFPILSWVFFLFHPVSMAMRVQPFFLYAVVMCVLVTCLMLKRPAPASS